MVVSVTYSRKDCDGEDTVVQQAKLTSGAQELKVWVEFEEGGPIVEKVVKTSQGDAFDEIIDNYAVYDSDTDSTSMKFYIDNDMDENADLLFQYFDKVVAEKWPAGPLKRKLTFDGRQSLCSPDSNIISRGEGTDQIYHEDHFELFGTTVSTKDGIAPPVFEDKVDIIFRSLKADGFDMSGWDFGSVTGVDKMCMLCYSLPKGLLTVPRPKARYLNHVVDSSFIHVEDVKSLSGAVVYPHVHSTYDFLAGNYLIDFDPIMTEMRTFTLPSVKNSYQAFFDRSFKYKWVIDDKKHVFEEEDQPDGVLDCFSYQYVTVNKGVEPNCDSCMVPLTYIETNPENCPKALKNGASGGMVDEAWRDATISLIAVVASGFLLLLVVALVHACSFRRNERQRSRVGLSRPADG